MNWIKTLDKPRTAEWQLGLSSAVLYRVWQAWLGWKRASAEEYHEKLEKFEEALRASYQQVEENDVFFSGAMSKDE